MQNIVMVTVLTVVAAVIACAPSSTDAELFQHLAIDPPFQDDPQHAETRSDIAKQHVRSAAGASAGAGAGNWQPGTSDSKTETGGASHDNTSQDKRHMRNETQNLAHDDDDPQAESRSSNIAKHRERSAASASTDADLVHSLVQNPVHDDDPLAKSRSIVSAQSTAELGAGVKLPYLPLSVIVEPKTDVLDPANDNVRNETYRDQKVLRHLRRGQETRRRKLAEVSGSDAEITGCTDSMASNFDAAAAIESGSCSYDCVSMMAHYFPDDEEAATSKCFLYDGETESWPEALMGQRTNATESVCWNVPGSQVFSDGSAPTLLKPSDENWLIQGRSNVVDGVALPVVLDARIESLRSNGSVVLRHLRVTGQDIRGDRCAGVCPDEQCGTVAFFFGVGGRGSVQIVFDHVILDHNFGQASGGRDVYRVQGRDTASYVGNTSLVEWNHVAWTTDAHLGMEFTIVDSHFIANGASANPFGSGDISPLKFVLNRSEVIVDVDTPCPTNCGPAFHDKASTSSTAENFVQMGQSFLFAHSKYFIEDYWDGEKYVVRGGGAMFELETSQQLRAWDNVTKDIVHQNIDFQDSSGNDWLLLGTYAVMTNAPMNFKFTDSVIRNNTCHRHTAPACRFMFVWGHDGPLGYESLQFTRLLAEDNVGEIIRLFSSSSVRGAQIADSAFINNFSPVDSPIVILGSTDLEISRCSFIRNRHGTGGGVATAGAISIGTWGVQRDILTAWNAGKEFLESHATIRDSVFDGNELFQSADGAEKNFIVDVNGGPLVPLQSGENLMADWHLPHRAVWWIDDGPMFGNESKFDDPEAGTYAEIVSLGPGPHQLHVGIISRDNRNSVDNWNDGHIGIGLMDGSDPLVSRFDPQIPLSLDPRNARVEAGECSMQVNPAIAADACGPGGLLSISVNFSVNQPSYGGAIFVGNQGAPTARLDPLWHGTVSLIDSTFRNNMALDGLSLYAQAGAQLHVFNTTFEPDPNAVSTALDIDPFGCAAWPCPQGQRCSFVHFSVSCHDCGPNEIGDGVECTACAPGSEPNDNKTSCDACSGGKVSTFGICIDCAQGGVPDSSHTLCVPCPLGSITDTDGSSCIECGAGATPDSLGTRCDTCPFDKVGQDGKTCQSCPDNQEPAPGQTQCRCKAGFYNATFGVVRCPSEDGGGHWLSDAECQPCGACLDCQSTIADTPTVLVRPGFSLGLAAANRYRGIERGDLHDDKVFHSCTRDMCVGESINSVSVHSALTIEMLTAATNGSARTVFEAEFASAVAGLLNVTSNEITVNNIVWADSGSLRRTLQDVQAETTSAVVSFTISVDSSRVSSLVAAIRELRDAPDETIAVGTAGTALTSTFLQPSVSITPSALQCRPGHDPTSPMCHLCLDGWVQGMDQMCFECETDSSVSPWVRVIALCVGIVFAGGVLIGLYYAYQRHAARGAQRDAAELHWVKPSFTAASIAPLAIYFKICVSHYQILGQFPVLYEITFPSVFQDWLDVLSVLSLDLYTFVGIHCVADLDMYDEFAITMTIPAVGLILLFAFYRARVSWIQRSATQAADTDAEKAEHGNAEEKDAATKKQVRDQAFWLATGWLYMVYVILCRTTFQSFACHDLDDGESFHRNDYSVDCNSDAYKAYAVAAAIFIAIYPVGILVLFVSLLYLNRGVLSGRTSCVENDGKWWSGGRETFDFLVDGYRSETYWFEIVDFLRKILLAGVVIFFDRGSSNQFFVGILISIVFLC
eukprot:SAG31_NODE_1623_length_7720_cov_6.277785_1_plen_1725_part_10